MLSPAADIARRLAEDAEAVCRRYLSNGRKQGRYWVVGDVQNTPGRSLYIRLAGPASGPGAAGKWTDSATGQHGDLLDLIALNMGIVTLRDTLEEARGFLSLPQTERHRAANPPASRGSPEAARRLWAMGHPMSGTLAERHLAGRGLTGLGHLDSLRFHPNCFYWREDHPPTEAPETWPALLAKVTDLDGRLTGLHRTWLDPATADKAPVIPPRKAMGNLLGHGVRIGEPDSVLAAGEGLETMLSLHLALPELPLVAALSANHLAALQLPTGLRRLYIAVGADPAGLSAADQLMKPASLGSKPVQTSLEDCGCVLFRMSQVTKHRDCTSEPGSPDGRLLSSAQHLTACRPRDRNPRPPHRDHDSGKTAQGLTAGDKRGMTSRGNEPGAP